ncbi:MAG: hypothetical protein K2W95_21485 [Candidatus Obscuribacterales bacterium]|nr:hypothetical protein [Candidatus Obscuribacterales bacterium]
MDDYEKLGVFYLGKRYDPHTKSRTEETILYDSKDLVTHAVCVGMTGSGKTGLCIDLIEEAAIDRIPIIAIDPKGDLANLLLTFPSLDANSFLPWISQDECRRKGIAAEELASQIASQWKNGLQEWQQDGDRIQRLKDAAEFTIYTPASNAATSLSIMHSFDCPDSSVLEDSDLLREQINCTATSILALLSLEADPLKSKEHILLSSILSYEWKAGRDLNLYTLVEKIANPPFKQLGAMPLDSIYSAADRFQFAMSINNLLAAPGFESWLEGEPLDIDRLLYGDSGKPKVSIISIAHLPDSERMFFVSLLLTRLLSWVRRQSGTTSLRAILYMDEVLGYFPPVANPPSKPPLISLLKQARAFGLGVVLATQNPVDLDYKALGNTGTWFIGRLQTERDKMRVLEGLETAADAGGRQFDRQELDRLLSSLERRIFLMNNVHEDGPVLLETRWSLSWLRGPMSRNEMKTLSAVQPVRRKIEPADLSSTEGADTPKPQTKKLPPMLPPDVYVRYAPVRKPVPSDAKLVYKPMLAGRAEVRFTDIKHQVDQTRQVTFLTLLKGETAPVNWDKCFAVKMGSEEMSTAPAEEIEFAELPAIAATAKAYIDWKKDFIAHVLESQKLEIYRCPVTKLSSHPDETERDFRIRLMQDSHEDRDRQLEQLRKKYSDKLGAVQDKLLRAKQTLDKELAQARQADMQSALALGGTILGAVMGRKMLSRGNMRQAGSALNAANKSARQKQDVEHAQEVVEQLNQKTAALEQEFQIEMSKLQTRLDPISQQLERVLIPARKTNIRVLEFGLCWAPCVKQADGRYTSAW